MGKVYFLDKLIKRKAYSGQRTAPCGEKSGLKLWHFEETVSAKAVLP